MKKKSLNKKKRDVNTGLLDSLPLPAFIIGFNKGTFSDFLYVNPAFCHMIGYMREEMAGIKFNDICAYSGYVKAGFSKRNKSKTNIIRVVLIKKDKNRIPVELHVSSIKYNGKNSLLVLAIDRRENIIAEQAADEVLKMHLMRAEMWKLSACGCGEESELVEKIFSIIGPGLDASRLVFSALQGDSLVAISEWTAPGILGNMKGIKVPKQIFDAFKFTGQIVLDKSGIVKIFPPIIRPLITKIVDMLIKIAGEKPVLITPYFVDGNVQGAVSATGLSEPVTLWSDVKKGLLKETASVIATTIMINRQRKKKAEDENKFRAIMENIKGVFVRHYLNEDRVEMNYNEAYRQLLGFPEGYFDTNSMVKYRELVHPEDLERVEKISDDGARNKSSYYQEYRIRNISDNYIWVAESVAVMRNEKGEPVWTDNFIFDISAKKNNEIKLRETEEKFTAAFMKNPEYMSLTRLSDSVIVEANESFASRFGYKIEEIIGKTTVELGMWADPLDRQKWLQSLNEKKESLGYEVMLKDRYGKFFYALLSAVMIEISGEKYMLTVARDITDIKEAQKKT